MKNLLMFIIAFALSIALSGAGIASDLSKEVNITKPSVITPDLPTQKGTGITSDTIPTLDNSKLNSETLDLARRGCCSHHGGVCGCNEALDRIICCDGTLSPSCTCSGY